MGVRRRGVIYSAKKLRPKQPSAPSFFGQLKKKSPLRRLAFVLESIGKPIYWTLLIGIAVARLVGRQVSYTSLVIKKALTHFFAYAAFCVRRFRFPRIKPPKIKLPAIKPPKIRFPTLKIPKITLPRLTKKWLAFLISLCLLLFAGYLVYSQVLKNLPHPNSLVTRERIISTKILDRNGELLYKIYRNQNRTLVRLEDIPVSLIQSTIAIEDAEFYHHYGFSPKGIVRSFLRNLRGGKLYGGSTITQQLVKNALLSPERTFRRKAREITLAFGTEIIFSKDEILQMYLNEVGYGGAAYGAEEASQMYFGKSVRDLTLAEAALLAGLPASPTTYSPFGAHPEKAKERQALALRRMVEEEFITQGQAEKARAEELHFSSQRTDIKAPHFVMYLKELLVEKYGQQMVEEGGLEVKTSLDLATQKMAQKIVSEEIKKLAGLKVTNGATLVTDPATGEILAMVGSRDYFDIANDGNVNVTLRPRQPGSAIKPVNYSLALENGFTPATILSDTPITYRLPGQKPYSPRNYDGRFRGNIPLRVALASSYNVPAVKVLSALGVKNMVERGQEMGITTWEDPSRFGLSLTLGGGDVKMVDMAVVYGILANLGMRVDLNPILEVRNYKGEVLDSEVKSQELGVKRVLPPNIAYILTDILSDNVARTPAFGPNSVLVIPDHPHVAVKTGTTQNLRDNWTIGYTPDYLVGVWVGNNDNTPMSHVASGITGASPIWQQIMASLLKDMPDKEFPKPEDLSQVEICSLTGTLPCQGCPTKTELFLPGTEPKNHCDSEKIKEILEKKEEKSS